MLAYDLDRCIFSCRREEGLTEQGKPMKLRVFFVFFFFFLTETYKIDKPVVRLRKKREDSKSEIKEKALQQMTQK